MIFRLILFLSLLVEVTSEPVLAAEVPSEPCKSTVTGTLEMELLLHRIRGDFV